VSRDDRGGFGGIGWSVLGSTIADADADAARTSDFDPADSI
jgi:hypothetical protein